MSRDTISTQVFGLDVLVVDDSDSNRKVATLILERLGCSVDSVKDGDEAVSMLGERKFDAVFMDCQMPINGLDATRMIRENEQRTGGHVSVIAYTAQAMIGDKEKCIAAGMDGYISKPATVDDFVNALIQVELDRA